MLLEPNTEIINQVASDFITKASGLSQQESLNDRFVALLGARLALREMSNMEGIFEVLERDFGGFEWSQFLERLVKEHTSINGTIGIGFLKPPEIFFDNISYSPGTVFIPFSEPLTFYLLLMNSPINSDFMYKKGVIKLGKAGFVTSYTLHLDTNSLLDGDRRIFKGLTFPDIKSLKDSLDRITHFDQITFRDLFLCFVGKAIELFPTLYTNKRNS